MAQVLTIDFISDLTCPWCAVGLFSLQQALDRLEPSLTAVLRCQPFERHPNLPEGGQALTPDPEEHAQLRALGQAVGFDMAPEPLTRLHNPFNAHRLLQWAGQEHPERQALLLSALLHACHRDRLPIDADDVLLMAVEDAGLDRERAMDILASDAFADDVRQATQHYPQAGVRHVPTLIVNGRYVLTGYQPPEALERALQSMAENEPTPPAAT